MVMRVLKMRLDSGAKFFIKTREKGWQRVNRRRFFDQKRKLRRRWHGEIQ